ncbi:MAG: N-acetylmuramoyl-L-alanine amidase [Erysipelothrix sp.]|nr:N-acetylmuramoyl-L-alanine amidase [Erysipelothrix sp.]
MLLQPKAVSRRRRKLKWKYIIPVILLAMLLVYVAGSLLWPNGAEKPVVKTICDYNAQQSREKVSPIHSPVTEFNDYFVYGETLNIFNSPYELGKKDLFIGKTVILINLCTGLERVYMLESTVDGQIPMEDLEEGFYEVFVMINLQRHRVVSNEIFTDSFTTIRRNGSFNYVDLIADRYLLENDSEGDPTMDKNYLFLHVHKATEEDENVYDIVIDPGHLHQDLGYTDFGYKVNDVIEANEMLRMALLLKAEFEQYGLKVLLTREGDEIVDTYNIDGRLHRGYLSNAKYYIEVQAVGAGNNNVTGMQVVYSSFASPRLPSAVFRHLIDQTDLESTGIRGTGSIPGVVPSGRSDGFDGRMVIRESGGIALSAGNYSQKARDENYSFAGESRLGLHTVTIEYMYITHAPSVVQWNSQIQNYARATAEGYANYLNLQRLP